MIAKKLFEKYAAEFGYDLTPDYRDYPSAMPMVEVMVAGKLDMGGWGNTPIVRNIAMKQPLTAINMMEGHFRLMIATRPESGVRNVQDLKGKTVGVLFGGDPQNAFQQILRWELGSADPAVNNMKLINTPSQAQASTVPKGTHATMVTYPAFLKAQKDDPNIKGIVNSFGYTEDYYKGPAGEGAGKLLESVKQSPFYPDGFYLHRSFWVVRNEIIDKHPKVVVAFIMAQQEAVEVLSKMKPGDVSDLSAKYWELPPDLGAKVVQDELLFMRGWVWPTEGDAWALVRTSEYMAEGKIIDTPLTWKQVTDNLAKGAPLLKEAYERMKSNPSASAFTDSKANDLRGLPVWEMEKWTRPKQ
jgi:ABC-type nitrate/sulfonate/bicarbonate transport system substrate-binding protein